MKLYKLFSFALGIAMMPMLAACDDNEEDIVKTPLDAPVITSQATFKSLECSWKPIDGAVKYGYELKDGNGLLIVRDVTQETSVAFNDLSASTDYVFSVWAYGAYESTNGTSATNTFDLRTKDLTKLATPQISITQPRYNSVQITWNEVEGAESYSYSVLNPNGITIYGGTTTDTSLSYSALKVYGVYTVSVTATTEQEGYLNSETAVTTFEVVQPSAPLSL